jgi:hypothetical protein
VKQQGAIFLNQFRPILLLACILPVPALANDEMADAIANFEAAAQTCKTAPGQKIEFELKAIPGRPVSEPATPDELERVKAVLAESSMPYDPVRHRASYEVALALVRAKNVAAFKVVADPASTASVQECLTKLASATGLEAKFD